MATKRENLLNPNSCWNKAELDEPVFILRSTDFIAPTIVTLWTVQYVSDKGGWLRMTDAQKQKFEDALRVAEAMRNYKKNLIDDDIPF